MNSSASSIVRSSESMQMIVQCPSCQTKFALETSALEGIEEPRFHCSRCDHVFSMEESRPPFSASVGTPRGAYAAPGSAFASSPSQPTSPPRAAKTPSRALEIPAKPPEPLHSTPPHERVYDELSVRDSTSSQMEFDFGALDRAIENRMALPADRFRERSSFSIRRAFEEKKSLPVSSDTLEFPAPFKEEKTSAEGGAAMESCAYASPTSEASLNAIAFPEAAIDTSVIASPAGDHRQRSWQALMLFASPLLFFLALLMAFSYHLRTHPTSAAWVSQRVFPAAPRPAPVGLYIKNSNFKKVILDNGETVHIVTGKIMNSTQHSFNQILLEGILFDALGKPLSRTKVDASTTLAKTRIKSLTLDMIRNIQNGRPDRTFRLNPNQDLDFSLALGIDNLREEISQARFFTVRLYSVKY